MNALAQSTTTTSRRTRFRETALDVTTLPREPTAAALPRHLTRKQLAQVITHYFFPCSPRTLEVVPLPYVSLPGIPALYDTETALAWAERRLAGAVRLTGGRKRAAT